jgi:ABC-type nitrate/sulfonate/bicarbonate transport system permease component
MMNSSANVMAAITRIPITTTLGAGWSTLVAAELVAATRGLGFMIQSAAQFLVTDVRMSLPGRVESCPTP